MSSYSATSVPLLSTIALQDDPNDNLYFESFPDTIVESYSTRWRHAGGTRNTAKTTAFWSGGSFGAFSLQLDYVAGLYKLESLGVADDKGLQEVDLDAELMVMESKVRWLQALCFPKPDVPRGGYAIKSGILDGEPPKILIVLSSFLVIRGVVDSFSVTWKPPFHPVTIRPYACSVSLGIIRLENFYPDYYDIKAFSGMVPSPPTSTQHEIISRFKGGANWVGIASVVKKVKR